MINKNKIPFKPGFIGMIIFSTIVLIWLGLGNIVDPDSTLGSILSIISIPFIIPLFAILTLSSMICSAAGLCANNYESIMTLANGMVGYAIIGAYIICIGFAIGIIFGYYKKKKN